jgi:hypothetical protein
MYLLITYYHKDQTTTQEVVPLEALNSFRMSMMLGGYGVQSITIDKYTKAELNEMGITNTGLVNKN